MPLFGYKGSLGWVVQPSDPQKGQMGFVLMQSTRHLWLFSLGSGVNFLRKGCELLIWVWRRMKKKKAGSD